MKKLFILSLAVLGTLVYSSCSLFGDDDPTDLGGSTDVPFVAVGEQLSLGTVYSDDTSLAVDASLEITSNDGGDRTAHIEFNPANSDPVFQDLADFVLANLVPNHSVSASGVISANVSFKATEDGMLDYLYGEPFVLVRYDDGVGTKYTVKGPDGTTHTREIVAKSTTDDFPFGFMYIKVSKVEEVLNAGGIRKVTYYVNHKFGPVYWEVTLDDGSVLSSYVYSTGA
jgi:hypothetical protein